MAKTYKNCGLAINLVGLKKKKIVFPLLGIIALINSSCGSTYHVDTPKTSSSVESLSPATTEPLSPVTTASQEIELAPSKLQEFDSIMLELDPDQQLVTKITQWNLSTTVNVTIGPGFIALSQERQNEIAAAMRDGLSQVCSCSPYLKFNTEDGQQLTEIGQYVKWQ